MALGLFEGDAGLPALEHTMTTEPIQNSSLYGKMKIDDIQQGGNWFLAMVCMEYKAGPISAFHPYHATLGRAPTIGTLLYDSAYAVVMTAIGGTPAAASPATLTASKCMLAPGFASRILFGPSLRKVPLRFTLYPYLSGGNVVWFTTT